MAWPLMATVLLFECSANDAVSGKKGRLGAPTYASLTRQRSPGADGAAAGGLATQRYTPTQSAPVAACSWRTTAMRTAAR
jgi:hypothetical protein